jgi:hypothetical protein
MPFGYHIDRTRRVVIARPTRVPTIDEWVDLLDRIAADPAFEAGFGIISDRRHLDITPSIDYVRATVAAIHERRHLFGASRWAVLTSHQATFGMARMAEAYADNRDIAFTAFGDLEEAIRWATNT